MPRRRVAAIVIKNNKILLMSRVNNGKKYHSFPGGSKEGNESLEEGVHRELFEETTVEVKIDRLVYKITWDNGDENYFYLCRYISGEPKLRKDSPEAKKMVDGKQKYKPEWVNISKLPNTLLYQLEIRDLVIKHIKNKFPQEPKELFIKVNERRSV